MESTTLNLLGSSDYSLLKGRTQKYSGKVGAVLSKNSENIHAILMILNKMWNLTQLDYELQREEIKEILRDGNNTIIPLSKIAKREMYITAIRTSRGNDFRALLLQSITEIILPRLKKTGIESFKLICDEITFTDFDSLHIIFSNHRRR